MMAAVGGGLVAMIGLASSRLAQIADELKETKENNLSIALDLINVSTALKSIGDELHALRTIPITVDEVASPRQP